MNIRNEIIPGFENRFWKIFEKLRNTNDEYKSIVLGLIFLKYVSDIFEDQKSKIISELTNDADSENPITYHANNVFWIPKNSRWTYLHAQVKQPNIGKLIDEAMAEIEKNNQKLAGVFPKNYAHSGLDKKALELLIDFISMIGFSDTGNRFKNNLSQAYDYLLSQFAAAERNKGGEFYTPHSISKLVVEMVAPYKGRIFDPCCGSGGMLVQCGEFIEEHGGNTESIRIYGQESNLNTWRLAFMNLAIRGINTKLELKHGDSLRSDLHPDLGADYILAHPPFNVSNWGRDELKNDQRWKYGLPPAHNANFAWIQHFIYHLAPTGLAGFIMPSSSMSSNQSNEKDIRRNIIEADLVDCIVTLPGQLLYSTQIPVCVWFIACDKKDDHFRNRQGEILFIDARMMGKMVDRVHRELTDEDINQIATAYHAWKGNLNSHPSMHLSHYIDLPGFCKTASLEDIRHNDFILTPGCYVDTAKTEEEETFEDKMKRLTAKLKEQQIESTQFDEIIANNLQSLGFGV